MDKTLDTVLLMLEGSTVTLEIFCVTLALALPLGLFVALGRLSRFCLLSRLLEIYIWIMRGTPLMLQLLFVYFALPMVGIMLTTFRKKERASLCIERPISRSRPFSQFSTVHARTGSLSSTRPYFSTA